MSPKDISQDPQLPAEIVNDPHALKPTFRECRPYAIQARTRGTQAWEAIEQTAKYAGRGHGEHKGMLFAFEESLEKDVPQFGRFALHQPIILTVGLVKKDRKTGEMVTIVSEKRQELVMHHTSPSEVAGNLLDGLPEMIKSLRKTHSNKKCDLFEIKLEWFVDIRVADADSLKAGIRRIEQQKRWNDLLAKRKTPHVFKKPASTEKPVEAKLPAGKIILEN